MNKCYASGFELSGSQRCTKALSVTATLFVVMQCFFPSTAIAVSPAEDPFERLHAHDAELVTPVTLPLVKEPVFQQRQAQLSKQVAVKESSVEAPASAPVADTPLKKDKKVEEPSLKFTGRVQVDLRNHQQETVTADAVEKTESTLFDMRRARFDVKGKMAPNIYHKFSVELVDTVKVKDAFMDLTLSDNLKLKAGQFTYPYGLESMGSNRYYEFMEASFMGETLSFGRDRGLALVGNEFDKRLFYMAAVLNGTGSKRPDSNKNMDYAIQGQMKALENSTEQFVLWVGGFYATGKRDSSVADSLEIAPETESTLTLFSVDLPEDVVFTRTRYALDAQLLFGSIYLGAEVLKGEYLFSGKAAVSGGYFTAGYFLTGEQRNIEEGLLERQPVKNPIGSGGTGAWEVAVRYSWFDTDASFFEADTLMQGWTALDSASNALNGVAWSVALNWYPTKYTRMMFNYTRTQATAADEAIGRFASESAVMVRAQIEF